MRKTLTYSSFIIASVVIVLVFLTATTYAQLAIAVVLYLPFAYWALQIFPRRGVARIRTSIKKVEKAVEKPKETYEPKKEQVEIADIDKRTFLKLIGATGLSFFLFSFLGRRAESLIFDRALDPGTTTQAPAPNGSPSMEGYRISEVDDNIISYYGFINPQGGWLIMREDTDTSSFRYAKGELNFPASWARRQTLTYDYFYKLF